MNVSIKTNDLITNQFMASRVVPEKDIDPLIKNLLYQSSVQVVTIDRQNTRSSYKLTRAATTRARTAAKMEAS